MDTQKIFHNGRSHKHIGDNPDKIVSIASIRTRPTGREMQKLELTEKQRKAWLLVDVWGKTHDVAAKYCQVKSRPSFSHLLKRARVNINVMKQICINIGGDPDVFMDKLKRDTLYAPSHTDPAVKLSLAV